MTQQSVPNSLTEIKQEIDRIGVEVRSLSVSVTALKTASPLSEDYKRFTEKIERLDLLINGDPTRDVEGVRHRLETAERELEDIAKLKTQIKYLLIGVGVSGVTGLINAGTLITLLTKVLGGP